MISFVKLCLEPAQRPRDVTEAFLALADTARATLCLDVVERQAPLLFEDIPVLVVIQELMYEFIFHSLSTHASFLFPLHGTDIVLTFRLKGSSAISISLSTYRGTGASDFTLRDPMSLNDIFNLASDVLAESVDQIGPSVAELVTDPILRKVVRRLLHEQA
jgi:hypothetical protein